MKQEAGETPNDRNDRAIRVAAAWYTARLPGHKVRCCKGPLLQETARDMQACASVEAAAGKRGREAGQGGLHATHPPNHSCQPTATCHNPVGHPAK